MNRLTTILVLVLTAAPAAWAETFDVDSTVDAVDAAPGNGVCATAGALCTLRAAIQEANALGGADFVNVPAGDYLLTLTGTDDDLALTGDLDVTETLTIQGSNARTTIVDARGIDRVFELFAGSTITDLTIRGGNAAADNGGGILIDSVSPLVLTDVTVSGCTARTGGGVYAKDIVLALTGVTLSGNTADQNAGGIFLDSTTATMTNVTVSGNIAGSDGGGVYHNGANDSWISMTVTDNEAAGKGGGVRMSGTISVKNSIVAGNRAPSEPNCDGPFTTSLGYNLEDTSECGFTETGDQQDAAPNLGPLKDNGGPNDTHALLIGSDALDAVLAGCPPPGMDQRGIARPLDGDGDTIAICDIGAYEAPVPPTISGTVFEDVNGDSDLFDAVAAGNVRLRLYEDVNDDGLVNAGDLYLDEVVTNAITGAYNFVLGAGTKFLVVVDSKTVSPDAGFNGGSGQAEVWAEQTYGDDSTTPALDLGPRVGARLPGTTDDVDPASTLPADNEYQHVGRVDLTGGSISGVNFAFSFNVVAHVLDGPDADVANARTRQGSLRQSIQNANAIASGATVTLPAGTYSLSLTGAGEDAAATGDLDITDDLTLSGSDASNRIVDGVAADRVFQVWTGVVATLSGITIRGGNAQGGRGGGIHNVGNLTVSDAIVTNNTDSNEGGGIENDGGGGPASLTVTNSTISSNTCPAGKGGGIHNIGVGTATFDLTDVTLSGNSADEGGAIRNERGVGVLTNVTISGNSSNLGGGILNRSTDAALTLTNVTISGNTSTDEGGGFQQQGTSATLTNVTITNNSAVTGGGLRHKSGTTQILNTLIAGNPSGSDCSGSITSNGYNLDGDGSCGLGGIGDIDSGTANLGPLDDNGGPVQTHAPLFGSDAIDAVLAGCPPPAADQRGVARPTDGDGDLTASCDIGAYEADAATVVSGTVYEDVNGDAILGDAVAAGNVRVRLYRDVNDNGQVDAADTYIDETSTNATTGVYSFGVGAGSKFLVAVDSKTVPSSDGFNGGHAQTDIWAEQTYGDDPATAALDLGVRLGGSAAGTSDDVDSASTDPTDNSYQHLARVDVSGGNVSGVDFAFSFRAVTHVGDSDDDLVENRTAQGSLRQLLQNANALVGAPSLAIPAGTYTLTLTGAGEDEALTGDLDVTDDVTLAGASASATALDGNRTDRVLELFAATVEISDLTVEKGDSQGDHGGGILIDGDSSLTLVDTMIRDNDGDRGGGIRVDGDLVMSGSTLYGNRGDQGGAIQTSGSTQSVVLTNVTISGNTATSRGGGLELDLTTLTNVTITGNASPDGGGIYRRGGSVFTVKNTIIAGNPSGGDCSNAFTSTGYNLDGDGTCALSGPGDISSGSANLGPLADNGGPTLTHALLAGSNAIDAVTVGCPPPATDQRGVTRPIGLTCDIGAYEGVLQTLKIVKRAFQVEGTPIASGSTVPKGGPVKFLLYINNPGGPVNDVSMRDTLDPAFLFLAGSIKHDNSMAQCALTVCSVVEEAALFAAADTGTSGTDAVDGDPVSFTGVTLDIGNESVANAQLDIAGGKVWAVVFTTRMQ